MPLYQIDLPEIYYIPWVQFVYNLRTPNLTLGKVWGGGMGLPITPTIDHKMANCLPMRDFGIRGQIDTGNTE